MIFYEIMLRYLSCFISLKLDYMKLHFIQSNIALVIRDHRPYPNLSVSTLNYVQTNVKLVPFGLKSSIICQYCLTLKNQSNLRFNRIKVIRNAQSKP